MRLLVGEDPSPPSYALASWLFPRALAGVFLIAFVSLQVQLPGLIGSHGILPAAESLRWMKGALGGASFLQWPTVFWLDASDAALRAVGIAGVVLALLVILGVAQRWALLLLWLLYLSLLKVGSVFLGYQWDVLLVEAGLLGVFMAPGGRGGPLFLLRWLLFRLMLLSGLVKLASGDATWWSLRALEYHFWTQPLPTWLGFWASRLPAPLLKAGTGVMFFIELVLPFFIFGPRRLRRTAAAGFALLQILIAATGNYGFFNLLTLVLCLTLVDDALLARWFSRWPTVRAVPTPGSLRRGAFAGFAALVVLVSGVEAARRLRMSTPLPSPMEALLERVRAFESINVYGLFAVMTTERPEIDVQGSDDGVHWRSYVFKWKPGPLDRPPGFVAPHQPRLDWQMWFAALGDCRGNPWFLRFQQRLLEGSAPVLALLGDNPFKDHPPRYVRSTVYQYRFARPGEPGFWSREEVGPYCPTLTLDGEGKLRRASP